MKFDFYFKRTCFRTMTHFYKTQFKPIISAQSRGKRQKSASTTDQVSSMLCETHAGLVSLLSTEQRQRLTELLKMLIFCHRH